MAFNRESDYDLSLFDHDSSGTQSENEVYEDDLYDTEEDFYDPEEDQEEISDEDQEEGSEDNPEDNPKDNHEEDVDETKDISENRSVNDEENIDDKIDFVGLHLSDVEDESCESIDEDDDWGTRLEKEIRNTEIRERKRLKEIEIEKKYTLTFNDGESTISIDTRQVLYQEDILDIMCKNDIDFMITIASVSKFHRQYAANKIPKTQIYVFNPFINHRIHLGEMPLNELDKDFGKLVEAKIKYCTNRMKVKTRYHTEHYNTIHIVGSRIPSIDLDKLSKLKQIFLFEGNRIVPNEVKMTNAIVIYDNCRFFPYMSREVIIFKNCHFSGSSLDMLEGESNISVVFYNCTFNTYNLKLEANLLFFHNCDIDDRTISQIRGSSIRRLFLIDCFKVTSIKCLDVGEVYLNDRFRRLETKSAVKMYDEGIFFDERFSVVQNLTRTDIIIWWDIKIFKIDFPYSSYTRQITSDKFEEYVLEK